MNQLQLKQIQTQEERVFSRENYINNLEERLDCVDAIMLEIASTEIDEIIKEEK